MKLIKVTTIEGAKVLLNPDHIAAVRSTKQGPDECTAILIPECLLVKETPDEIETMCTVPSEAKGAEAVHLLAEMSDHLDRGRSEIGRGSSFHSTMRRIVGEL